MNVENYRMIASLSAINKVFEQLKIYHVREIEKN